MLVVAALTAACGPGGAAQGGGGSHGPAPEGRRAAAPLPSSAQSAATVARPTPQEISLDERSVLLDVVVTPRPDGLRVVSWWGCVETGCRGRRAIATVATSDDGLTTASYEPWSRRRWQAYAGARDAVPSVPALDGLLQQPVRSMAPGGAEGTQVVVAGGDGATLLPFEVAARTTDHGGSWETYDVDLGGEVLAYQSGAVGLADGRLLVLLDHFSDETLARPADRWHGLWASDGGDWSTYAPHRAEFEPPLGPAPGGWSPVVALDARQDVAWVRTWDSRLYVSRDDAATFRQVRAR
ncbi:hypothetical protein ASG94_00230 [Nocardioides sp. Soil805]|nr:hypothetical protein ASG94_00230 [Nocardioides sp. Soil805]